VTREGGRLRWRRAVVISFFAMVLAGMILGAMQIWERGPTFFTFRNDGAGAGNPAGLGEEQGPRFTSAERTQDMDLAIQVAGYLGGIATAFIAGAVVLGSWAPRRKGAAQTVARAEPLAEPEVISATVTDLPLVQAEPAPWEDGGFYREPARRHWWARRHDEHEGDIEAANFLSDIRDPVPGEPVVGQTTINSIEDVMAWGRRQQEEMDTWAAEQQERMSSWSKELEGWREQLSALPAGKPAD
jgi:hypothetical protein